MTLIVPWRLTQFLFSGIAILGKKTVNFHSKNSHHEKSIHPTSSHLYGVIDIRS